MVLNESFRLHRFLSEFRDLMSWALDMEANLSSEELAKDVSGAEALVERHSEFKGEIDARKDSFANVQRIGNELIQQDHYAKNDIELKSNSMIYQMIDQLIGANLDSIVVTSHNSNQKRY